MGGACSEHEEMKHECRTLVGKPEGKGLLGRPNRRWKNNIKLYLNILGLGGGANCIDLAKGTDRCPVAVHRKDFHVSQV
jgi:hypothetical protein